MNPKLKEINELIDLCDKMNEITITRGYVSTRDEIYRLYSK